LGAVKPSSQGHLQVQFPSETCLWGLRDR
jgi:hypothetical protein